MGTICGPTLANIYLAIKENLLLQISRPLFYKRFIDDIFIVSEPNFDVSYLKSFFPGLNLNIVTGNIVNFLDLVISFDFLTQSLSI